MAIALYAGSFDPITLGHLDIIKNGSEIFDKVIVGVTYNINKQNFLDLNDRLNLIKECTKDFSNVSIEAYEGLTVKFAKQKGAKILLRGIRNCADYEYEAQLSQANQKLETEIKTVLMVTKPEYSFISSSAVREILKNGGNISGFVPESVKEFLDKKYSKNY